MHTTDLTRASVRGDTFIFNGHIATVVGNFADFTKVSYTDADGSIFIVHITRSGICDPYVVAE